MSVIAESFQVIIRPGDSTGVGTTLVNLDGTQVQAVSPAKLKQDSNIVHDKKFLEMPFYLATPLAAQAFAMFFVNEGIWQVDHVIYQQVVNGTSPAFDVLWVAAGTAIGSGTTQLTGTISGSSAGNNNNIVRGTLIAAPTSAGPGQILGVNLTGTTTGMLGTLQIGLKRTG